MGLFSKIVSRLGMLRTRATAISGRFVSRLSPRAVSFLGRAKTVVRKGARVARFTPVGRAISVGLLGAAAVSAIRRRRKGRAPSGVGTVSTAATIGKLAGLKRAGLLAAGIGAAAFVAEQIAEKLGVRGGAGFVGRRITKRKPAKRRRRKKKVRKIARHRHKIVRLPARTVVRSVRRKKTAKRKGKRVSFTTATGQKVSFIAKS